MPQDIFAALRALLDQIEECLVDPCPYVTFVSRGLPPADCSSIAAWYGSSRRARDNQDCSTLLYDTTLNITVTHCCITPDGEVAFDFAREEIEAQCFLENLMAIRECLSCNSSEVLAPYRLSCGALVENVSADLEARGGCYSATLSLSLLEEDCCPEPV